MEVLEVHIIFSNPTTINVQTIFSLNKIYSKSETPFTHCSFHLKYTNRLNLNFGILLSLTCAILQFPKLCHRRGFSKFRNAKKPKTETNFTNSEGLEISNVVRRFSLYLTNAPRVSLSKGLKLNTIFSQYSQQIWIQAAFRVPKFNRYESPKEH